jgi:sulfur transfer complex TusBCD TusB component (DsrH family)
LSDAAEPDPFLESLMDTRLYSMGAFFCDKHPELIEDVIAQSEDIEARGLSRYADDEGLDLEAVFQTLVTGLAVRYFKAITG